MSQKKVDAYKARKGLHNKTDRKRKKYFLDWKCLPGHSFVL